ncbi:NUDIX hydrolase [Streptacidiphilus rugosus]|uniref:NUDIX hydrolase n=1 Tax=Streptacidiphilus rugosus TaxID=405783 RepID=UPI00056A0083|nr:NUDIX hydrolase [Streptacidiphilus rugosus]
MSEQPVTEQSATEQQGVAVAVVVSNGKVLLVRRRVTEGELSWQFPGGGIEDDESPAEAAARETYEETGLDVDGILLLGARVHPVTGRHVSYVVCALISGDAYAADDEELSEVAWVTRAELPAYVPHGLFAPVQRYLDEHLP